MMNKKKRPFQNLLKKLYKLIDKLIVTPISSIVYKIQSKIGKSNKLEKLLNKPNFLLYLSLGFAVLLFVLVDSKATILANTNAEYIKDQPVKVLYNSSAYVVEGVPKTVNITLIGSKSEIYLAKQLGDNEIVVDLTNYEPSDKPVEVKLTYNKSINSLDYRIDPSYVSVIIKKKISATKTLSYDLINEDSLDPKLSVKNINLTKGEVVVRGSAETIDKIASVRALIDLSKSEYTKAGNYVDNELKLAAYDGNGDKISNVEIVATKISANITLESYYKNVPIKIITEGNLVTGRAISSISINDKPSSEYQVTIYGEESILDGIENIEVNLDLDGLGSGNSKSMNIAFQKPAGVRYISEESITLVIAFGEAKQKTIKLRGIKTINVPNGLAANLSTPEESEVEVQVVGVTSIIDELEDNQTGIEAYVDLAGYQAGTYSVKVKIDSNDSRLQYIVTKNVNIVLSKSN